jgi:hypothetical protein
MNIRLRFVKCFAFSDLPTGWSVPHASTDWEGNPLLIIDEGKPPYPKDDPSPEARLRWAYALPTAQHLNLLGRKFAADSQS